MRTEQQSDNESNNAERKSGRILRILFRVLALLIAIPLGIVILAIIALYIPPVQDYASGRLENYLTEKLDTRVDIGALHLRFPLGLSLEEIYLETPKGDTLLYSGLIDTQVNVLPLLDNTVRASHLELKDIVVNLEQDRDSVFNFQFIPDAFSDSTQTAKTDTASSSGGLKFAFGNVSLENVRYRMSMAPSEMELSVQVNKLKLWDGSVDPGKGEYGLDEIEGRGLFTDMKYVATEDTTPDTYPNLVPPLQNIDLRLGNLALDSVRYTMKARHSVDSMAITAGEIDLNMRHLDLSRQLVDIERLAVRRPGFLMLSPGGGDTTATVESASTAPPVWTKYNDGFRYFVRDWRFNAGEINLEKGSFAMHSDSVVESREPLNPSHLILNPLDVSLAQVNISNDTIRTALDARVSPSELNPVALDGKFHFDRKSWSIEDLLVDLAGVKLNFRAAVRPGEISELYGDYQNAQIDAGVSGKSQNADKRLVALLDSLVPGLKRFQPWTFNANAKGTLAETMQAGAGLSTTRGTKVRFKGKVHQPMKWPNTRLGLDSLRLEMGRDLLAFVRQQVGDSMILPNKLVFTANANKAGQNANARFNLLTDLGNVRGSASTDTWTDTIPGAGAFALNLGDIDLARLAGDSLLGQLTADLSGELRDIKDSPSADIRLIADSSRSRSLLRSLNLHAWLKDDSLGADATLNHRFAGIDFMGRGRVDTTAGVYSLKSTLELDKVSLDSIGLVDYPLALNSKWSIEGEYREGGESNLTANAKPLSLSNQERTYEFDSLNIAASYGPDSTSLRLRSPALDTDFFANMPADSLIDRTSAKLRSYFTPETRYVPEPGSEMDLNVELRDTEWITGMLVPGLKELWIETLRGSYNSDEDKLEFKLYAPGVNYSGIQLDSLDVSIDADGDELLGTIGFERISSDSLYVENLKITARPNEKQLALQVQSGRDPEKKGGYNIKSNLERVNEALRLSLEREIVLNGEIWNASPSNYLEFGENFRSNDFALSRNTGQISILAGSDSLRVELSDFALEALTGLVQSPDSADLLTGKAFGHVSTRSSRVSADLKLADFSYLDTRIGEINVQADGNPDENIEAQASLVSKSNEVKANLKYNSPEDLLEAQAQINIGELKEWKSLVEDYVFRLTGGLEGDLEYVSRQGTTEKVEGSIGFRDAKVGLNITGGVYTFPSSGLNLDQQGLRFEQFSILDSAGNKFAIDGRVSTENFVRYELDLGLNSEGFQIVSSTRDDNELFYGDLWAAMDYDIKGTLESPEVDGEITILGKTDFTFEMPGSSVEMIESDGIVMFTEGETNMDSLMTADKNTALSDSLRESLPGVDLQTGIKLEQEAKFTVVLDPVSKDRAVAQGSADLDFSYEPSGLMDLSGKYELNEGYYALNFYGLVKKRFELVPGGTITWNGDPSTASLDIAARYTEKTSPYPLVARPGVSLATSEINELQQRVPFNVIISIGGRVNEPSITFNLTMAEDYRANFPRVTEALERLKSPDSESLRNKQVFGLLVLGSFIRESSADTPTGSSVAAQAARNSVNGILTDQLNRLAGGALPGFNVSLGVSSYDQYTQDGTYTQTALDYSVSKSFINDRLTFEVGGSVGINEGQQAPEELSENRAMEYAVMYDLTPDGNYRLRGFRENAYNLFDGEIINSGISIIFSRDFEKGESPFSRPKGEEDEEKEETPKGNDKATEEE